jgi:two-component system CheB/CheR fusion protein
MNRISGSPKAPHEQEVPHRRALPAWLRRLGCYGLTLLLVATGATVRAVLARLVGPGLPVYIMFYPAVMLAALVGGWGPGLLATLTTAAVADYWLLPPPGWKIESPVDEVGLVIFCCMGIFMSIVAELYRRTRGHLEELVLLRTTALNQANEHLQERDAELQTQTQELTAVNATLRERMKELACLYAVSRDIQDGLPVDELCRRVVELLVPAMQFPDITVPVIELNGRRFTSEGYTGALSHELHAEIRVEGKTLGHLRVYYAQERPFLIPEEQNLVNGVAEVLSTWLERKRAEETMRQSEEKYRQIVETATEAIVMVDAAARIVFVNGRWSEIFGYSREEAGQMTHFDLVFPEDMAVMKQRWESRKGGRQESYELHLRRKDGSPLWALIGVAPTFGSDGEFLGTLTMIADITERKNAEEALRDLNATLESKVAQRTQELTQRARQLQKLTLELTEAEERERARIAEILHDDLQQVLAATKFQIGLLGSRIRNDADAQQIAGQAKDLLTEAIAKSRSLSHELSSPALSQSDLGEAFEWLAEQMQKTYEFTVHLDMEGRIEVASEGLRVLLYKAAQELLFNAIKHAGVHEARLRLRRQGGCLRLSVSDRGRGFDPSDPAYKLGFGLLSLRERVASLGGRLRMRSVPDKGSTFFLLIPDDAAGVGSESVRSRI